jgi:hypothetical protein
MTRIIVPLDDGKTGWFDLESAERFDESTTWNGENHVGDMSGIPKNFGYEALYRTKGGKWVRNRDATRYFNQGDEYEFITDEQAREWLIKTGQDEAVERFFGEIEEERGPGRPEIGPMVNVRLGGQLTAKVDAARRPGESQAAAIRRLLTVATS